MVLKIRARVYPILRKYAQKEKATHIVVKLIHAYFAKNLKSSTQFRFYINYGKHVDKNTTLRI